MLSSYIYCSVHLLFVVGYLQVLFRQLRSKCLLLIEIMWGVENKRIIISICGGGCGCGVHVHMQQVHQRSHDLEPSFIPI